MKESTLFICGRDGIRAWIEEAVVQGKREGS